MATPPDYLEGKVIPAAMTDPASLLQDGQWCGHGEPIYNIFDVRLANDDLFTLQLPESDDDAQVPPMVMVKSDSGVTFAIYDSRKHPASTYHPDNSSGSAAPRLQSLFHCPNCDKQRFKIAVGFEVPSDSQSANDTSWFALAAKCVACNWQEIVYDDETA